MHTLKQTTKQKTKQKQKKEGKKIIVTIKCKGQDFN